MNLYRATFHKYISVTAKHLAIFYMSLQTCASDSGKIFAMCASIITFLKIIITVTTMKNRPDEPDSWDVIDNLDIEVEQQSILIFGVL